MIVLKPKFEVGQKLFYKNHYEEEYEITIDSIEIDNRNQTFIYWYHSPDLNKGVKRCFSYKAFEKSIFFSKEHYIQCEEKELHCLMNEF